MGDMRKELGSAVRCGMVVNCDMEDLNRRDSHVRRTL